MGGSEPFHSLVDGFDERQHRLLQLALELRFMSLKPLPAIISFQAAKEFEAGFTKVRFAGDMGEGGGSHLRTITKIDGMPVKAAKIVGLEQGHCFLFMIVTPQGILEIRF